MNIYAKIRRGYLKVLQYLSYKLILQINKMNDKTIKDTLSSIKEQIDIFAEAQMKIQTNYKLEYGDVRITVFSKIKTAYINFYAIVLCIDPLENQSHPFWSCEKQYFKEFDHDELNDSLTMFLKISLVLTIFSCIEHFINELLFTKKPELREKHIHITQKMKELKSYLNIKKLEDLKNYKCFEIFQKIRILHIIILLFIFFLSKSISKVF